MKINLLIILFLAFVLVFNSLLFAYEKNNDFELNNLQGNVVRLSDYQDKNVILFFWAIYCPACINSLEKIDLIYPKLEEKNIQFLSINIHEGKTQVSNFLAGRNIFYPVLFDSGQRVARKFNLHGIPSFVFINKEGRVLNVVHRLSESSLKIFD